MEFIHASVLFNEVMDGLDPKPDGIYLDGTLGGGGHSSGICSKLGEDGLLVGIDRDNDALCAAGKRLSQWQCRKEFVHARFSEVKSVLQGLGIDKIDGALLDLGVSSFQLDNPDRGFSYMREAPLDMRMDRRQKLTAEDVVNKTSERELVDIFKKYGEIPDGRAHAFARVIVSHRPIKNTLELAELIRVRVHGYSRVHPATQVFQAIRIVVNSELEQIEKTLPLLPSLLKKNGRLAIITFHSLEDRLVKNFFKEASSYGEESSLSVLTKKPIIAESNELAINPRARSAKLRIAKRN